MKRRISALLTAVAMAFAMVWSPVNSLATDEASVYDISDNSSVEQIATEALDCCNESTDGSIHNNDEGFGVIDDSDVTEGSGDDTTGTEVITWPDSSETNDSEKVTENTQSAYQTQITTQSQDNMNSWRYQNGQLSISDEYGNLDKQSNNQNGISLFSLSSSNKSVVAKGIDVSEHQGWIDWDAVKNSGEVDFAILRVGYGDDDTSQDDKRWTRNVSECERLGIPYGVYIYSYAQSYSQINSEVAHVKRLLSGHSPSYPVYIDMEDDSTLYLGRSTLTQFAKSFCDQINNAGYTAGVYANLNWLNNYLYATQLDSYDCWVAQYYSSCWYDGDYSLWQYSSSGSVSGISGNVDMNYCYTHFDDAPDAKVKYSTHVQDIGWMQYENDGSTSGTTGQAKRLEGIKVELGSAVTSQYSGSIQYRTHIQNLGWESGWKSDGEISGTSGQSLRLEAIQIKLTGELANKYDIYYRVHAQNFGWLGWAKNGESAGTEGYAYRLEAIEIQLVAKDCSAPGSTEDPFFS